MWPSPGVRGRLPYARTAVLALAVGLALAALAAPVAAEDGEDDLPRYWEVHAALLSLATFLFVASYLALFLKWLSRLEPFGLPTTKGLAKLWFKGHMWLGIAGVACALAGIAVGYYMVGQAYGGPHLRLTHSWVGLATLAVVLPPLASGLVWRRVKKGKPALKWWHLALGLVGIGIMLAGAITGWALE